MEKKGNILNQLAIISDLLEKANMESTETSVVFNMERAEFNRLYNIIYINAKNKTDKPPKNVFQVKIGNITMIFNTNSA